MLFSDCTWDDIRDTFLGRMVQIKIDDMTRERDRFKKINNEILDKQEAKIKSIQNQMERDMMRRVQEKAKEMNEMSNSELQKARKVVIGLEVALEKQTEQIKAAETKASEEAKKFKAAQRALMRREWEGLFKALGEDFTENMQNQFKNMSKAREIVVVEQKLSIEERIESSMAKKVLNSALQELDGQRETIS